MDPTTIVRFVQDECGGDTKEAAKRMGVSVSYILHIAPQLKTRAQIDFDANEHNMIDRVTGQPKGRSSQS